MRKLNVRKLMDTISEAEAYSPEIGDSLGVKYLYERFYTPLINGAHVRFSEIDFTQFALEEIGDFEDYYASTLCDQNRKTDSIREQLCRMLPAASKARFI